MEKLTTQLSVRVNEDVAKELQAIAALGHVAPTEALRLCILNGMPIVRAGFEQMKELSTSVMKKAKSRELTHH